MPCGGVGSFACAGGLSCSSRSLPVSALRRGIYRVRRAARGGLRSAPQATFRYRPLRYGLLGLVIVLELVACTVGPDYLRAPAPVPTTFKELKGWKVAHPSDTVERGRWWAVYKDQQLDDLAQQIEISNQTV